jgi:hypothetical protein
MAAFCSEAFTHEAAGFFLFYVLSVSVLALLGIYVGMSSLAIVMLSVLPGLACVVLLVRRFRKTVVVVQVFNTWVVMMVMAMPVTLVELCLTFFLDMVDASRLVYVAILSYAIAGVCEEVGKYIAVRMVFRKPYVVDPRALMVYGGCAGAAFGTVENLMFTRQYGMTGAVLRAFTAVPLHCVTGMMIGVHMAMVIDNRDAERWYRTLLLPVVWHGTYDMLALGLAYVLGTYSRLLVSFVMVVVGLVYVRYRALRFSEEEEFEDVEAVAAAAEPGCLF